MELNGKVALVTGGANGIGKAYCNILVANGLNVAILDTDEQSGLELEKILKTKCLKENKVLYLFCDVTDSSNFESCFQKVISYFGRADILINNAGVFDEINWRKCIQINFIAAIEGIQLATKYLTKNYGVVVNTSSVAGIKGDSMNPVYSATKAAINFYTNSLESTDQNKETGLKVMSICPGPTDTNLLKHLINTNFSDNPENQKKIEYIRNMAPDKPEIVAELFNLEITAPSGRSIEDILKK